MPADDGHHKSIIAQVNPNLGGLPLWEYAVTHQNELAVMLKCCGEIERVFYGAPHGSRLSPAPFYFVRSAILRRKVKDYASEIAICERWIAMATIYASQPRYKSGLMALVNLNPSGQMVARVAKARALFAPKTSPGAPSAPHP